MLFPYQIADVPLFRYLVGSDDPVQFALEQKWDIPVITFGQSRGRLYQGPDNRSLAQPTSAKIEGVVQAKNSSMAQELLTSLQVLGGRLSVPLIVFRYEDPLKSGVASEIDWLTADAVITSKSQPMPYSGTDLGSAGHVRLRLDIDITLMGPFRRLYPWFWEYRPYQNRPQNMYVADGASSESNSFIHPRLFSEINDEYFFIRWLNRDTLSNPEFWEVASSGAVQGGQGMEFNEIYSVFYHSDPQRWSSPPQVVYAFTNLLPYGNLEITVQRSSGQFYGDDYEEISTLDLEDLNADLALQGYGGLFNSDILYVGDIFPFPSYILRNGEILSNLTPSWDYNGLFPGELQTGPGRVRFSASLSSFRVAYSFFYGVF